jgi:hypothetical protein
MVRGYPDWDRIKKGGAVSAMADLGELAVRLGSIVRFDRRGDVVFLENFQYGIGRWAPVAIGTGAAVATVTDRFMSAGYSMRVTSPSDALFWTAANLTLPYPYLSKFGFEVGVCFGSVFDYLVLLLSVYDGTNQHRGEIRYYYTDSELRLVDQDNSELVLGTNLDLFTGVRAFNVFKLICDLDAKEFTRLQINEKLYDLSAYPLREVASSTSPRVLCQIMLYGLSDENDDVYVDNVIVTQNEP